MMDHVVINKKVIAVAIIALFVLLSLIGVTTWFLVLSDNSSGSTPETSTADTGIYGTPCSATGYDYDISITPATVHIPEYPIAGEEFEIRALYINTGRKIIDNVGMAVYLDGKKVYRYNVSLWEEIKPCQDGGLIKKYGPLDNGWHTFRAELVNITPQDDNLENNIVQMKFRVIKGAEQPSIV